MILANFYQNFYKPYVKEHQAESSLRRLNSRFAREFIDKFGTLNLNSLNPIQINAFLFEYGIRYKSKSVTNSNNKVFVGAILKHAFKRGFLSEDITENLENFKIKYVDHNILKKSELRALLTHLRIVKSDWYHIFLFAAFTGLRYGELLALRWDDIDCQGQVFNIVRSKSPCNERESAPKTGYQRKVPINGALLESLYELGFRGKEHILPREGSFLNGCASKSLQQISKELNLTKTRFHDFRAYFATQLLSNGVCFPSVMKICGWRDIKTVRKYLRLSAIDIGGTTDCLQI